MPGWGLVVCLRCGGRAVAPGTAEPSSSWSRDPWPYAVIRFGPGNSRASLRPATVPGVDTPVGQLMNIVVDCPDAGISARFWTAVLGWERVQENAGFVDIADPSDGRRRLVFQQIADYRPPGWPDQGPPQQLHLDVRVDDLQIADQRVRALGAVPLGEPAVLEDETYRVYADPAGHPFCLVQLETT
jgi:catechol 2,3-dioxygenase-like lactoylglutathione lyase family enzyme